MISEWTVTKRTKIIVGILIACFFLLCLSGKLIYYVRCHPCPEVIIPANRVQETPNNNGNESSNKPGTGMRRRLPKALIIGVQKSGTGALLKMLDMHPDIKIASREFHFFDQDENYSRGAEWYRRQMPLSYPNQITIEKTPGYCDSNIAAERIFLMNPLMKILIIVREPTVRAISQYVHVLLNMQESNRPYDSFEHLAVPDGYVDTNYKCVKRSMYINFLEQWLDVFPREQIHVVDGDQLILDPASELQKVQDFLGLESLISKSNFYYNKTRGFYCMINGPSRTCLQKSKGRKHPEVNPTVVEILHNFYRPYNNRFQEVFEVHFDWP